MDAQPLNYFSGHHPHPHYVCRMCKCYKTARQMAYWVMRAHYRRGWYCHYCMPTFARNLNVHCYKLHHIGKWRQQAAEAFYEEY